MVDKWIEQFALLCKEETRRWFSDFMQPPIVVSEVISSPRLAQKYIQKYTALNEKERVHYDVGGLFSNPDVYKALRAWAEVKTRIQLRDFADGNALWKWYLDNFGVIVIHNAACERAFSILNSWFRQKLVVLIFLLLEEN